MDFENILRTIQPFVIMFAALFGAFLTAIWISVVIWTFRDIRSRSRDVFAQILATLMVLIFFPFFPLPGLILYMILRPRQTLAEVYERSLEEEALLQGIEERMACPGCNRRIHEEYMICPTCHTRLKKACVSCGRLLHLRWNICPWCGAVQTAAKAIPSAPQPVALQPEPVAEVSMLAGAAASSLPEPAVEAHDEEPLPDTEVAFAEDAGYVEETGYVEGLDLTEEPAPDEIAEPAEEETWISDVDQGSADEETWIVESESPSEAETLIVETDEPALSEERAEEGTLEEKEGGPNPTGETLPFDFE
jgi:RNA polymerase subunit RPABC4/transcription elongation factor Spt4